MQEYIALLKVAGCARVNVPFFLPTDRTGKFVFANASGKGVHLGQIVRKHMRAVFTDVAADKTLAGRFRFHSLRRGGAEHALSCGVECHLVQQQGAWASLAGMEPYIGSSVTERMSVTMRM